MPDDKSLFLWFVTVVAALKHALNKNLIVPRKDFFYQWMSCFTVSVYYI